MSHWKTLLLSRSAIAGVIALGAGVAAPVGASAEDWLDSIQDSRCAPEDIAGITGNVRNAIEASVRRAEMSIQAPTPVGDLGCLNDLMTAPLDIFSNVGGLLGSLQSGLGDIASMSLNLDIDVSGMICGFAAKKFATLTQPLSEMDKTMSGFASLAANADDRINGQLNSAFSEITDSGWDSSANTTSTASGYGGYSGIVSSSDSSGYSGTISDYTLPDVSPSASDVEEVTYTVASTVVNNNSDAWNLYNQRLMMALGQYIGCRVGGQLDGTQITGTYHGSGTWNVPGHISSCTFNPGAWPATLSSDDGTTIEVAPSSNSSGGAARNEDVDREGGQDRSAPAAAQNSSPVPQNGPATIWDMLDK
ncbi:hypothetical protein [Leisingera caerulea]|uniref:hypothetical protein n=1 Tax=Leisingera caerulea TaxID=506591 RepID=UPI000427DDE9|nr:hypothetical protein [Leisingera caerulea]